MRTLGMLVLLLAVEAAAASAQSLHVTQGERAAEASLAWSVGPFSQGGEAHAGVSLDGRIDLGFGVNRYWLDVGGVSGDGLTELAPFARYYFFKESDDQSPVTIAGRATFALDLYDGAADGWYALLGADVSKSWTFDEDFTLIPYINFSVAAESYGVDGAPADRSFYLTRQFGVHALVTISEGLWFRVTAEEQSFRRESYRALRLALIRRF